MVWAPFLSFYARHKVTVRAVGAVLTGMLLGTLTLALISAGEIYEYQDSVDGATLPDVDAIVVLAGGRGRIAAAGDVWYRYWEAAQADRAVSGRQSQRDTPILYVSGMGPKSNWNVFAKQLRRGVLAVIQRDDVILETVSTNTEENARWFAHHAEEHGWKRILLITSRYHMRRARYIFDRFLRYSKLPVGVETLSLYQEPFEPDEWRSQIHGIKVTVDEYLKWVYYKSLWRP